MKPQFQLRISRGFNSAHFLPNMHEGHACRCIHGHRYKVTLCIIGPKNEEGYVVDFCAVRAELGLHIAQLDHKMLNDVLPDPTSENLCEWFLLRYQPIPGTSVAWVEIEEDEGLSCRLYPAS